MKAYLAGAIEHAPDNGEAWRREVSRFLHSELQHAVYDPTQKEQQVLSPRELDGFRDLKENNLAEFCRIVRKIIRHDLSILINEVDYVICFWDRYVEKGGGTHGELTLAFHHSIPVYLVTGLSAQPVHEISGWILGCASEIFISFEHLEKFLTTKYG